MTHQDTNIITLFQSGYQAQVQGQFQVAIDFYNQLLLLDPKHFDALHLSGVAHYQIGHIEAAIQRIEQAIQVFDKHATAFNNLGVAYQDIQLPEKALNAFNKAIELNPKSAAAYSNRGNTWIDLQEFDKALEDYYQSVEIAPHLASSHSCLGFGFQKQNRWDEALAEFHLALEIDPNFFDALNNRATVYLEQEQFQLALIDIEKALSIRPKNSDASNNYINALRQLGRLEQALAIAKEQAALEPNKSMSWNQLGITTRAIGNLAQGIEYFERGVALDPADHKIWGNLGNAYHDAHQFDKAILAFEKALLAKPDYIEARWNRSLLYLTIGEYEKGWQDYELRWEFQKNLTTNPKFSEAKWQGQALETNQKLFIYAEQGLGDTIQFIRYLPKVKLPFTHFYVQVQSSLYELYKQNYPEIQWVKLGEPIPQFDFHISLLSLPFLYQTRIDNIPSCLPLAANLEQRNQWQTRLGEKTKPRIGLVWRGNPSHKNDRRRSIPLKSWLPYLNPSFEWIALQKEISIAEKTIIQDLSQFKIYDQFIQDFRDTCALCEQLDLVITVDTSVAHFAASMNIPTWITITHASDWRWLTQRTDSPWYPSVTLLRQSQPDSWQEVLENISQTLLTYPF